MPSFPAALSRRIDRHEGSQLRGCPVSAVLPALEKPVEAATANAAARNGRGREAAARGALFDFFDKLLDAHGAHYGDNQPPSVKGESTP